MILALVLAVPGLLVVITLFYFLVDWICYHRYLQRSTKRHVKPLRKTSLCMLAFALILSTGVLGYSIHNIHILKTPSDEGEGTARDDKTTNGSAIGGSLPVGTVPPVDSIHTPTGPVRSIEELVPEYFHLSDVKNSAMLLLFKEVSTDGMTTASGLAACAREFNNYLERCAHPRMFYSFYEGLEPLFPKGNVKRAFEDVSTYEESMAQVRGAGAALESYRDSNDSGNIYDACYHLAIRSKDALYFGTNDKIITTRITWVLGEIAYAALINESVYGELSGSILSDWYYRIAQIFEYMGDIADTDELQLHMYYVAAVCYFCAYEQISNRGLTQAGGDYGEDIWDAYFEMVFKVAVRTDEPNRKDFFMIILEGEINVETSGLSDTVIEKTQEKLKKLGSYWSWKESPEGIAAAQDLAARREEGYENA